MDIPEGAIIKEDMLDVKRPGTGIPPTYLEIIVGRKARENIKKDEIIAMRMITW